MDIYLSVNNREQVICLPVLPAEFTITKPQKNEVFETVNHGELKLIGKAQLAVSTELTSINDLVWELAHRGIISDKELWLKKLEQDSNAYWLARKTVKYIQSKNI